MYLARFSGGSQAGHNVQLPDGRTEIQWERPAPLIEPLKVRILDVLDREGKALVALNTLLIAGDLHAEIIARKVRIRDDAANRLIWNFALAKGAAVALNPVAVADMAGVLAVDVGDPCAGLAATSSGFLVLTVTPWFLPGAPRSASLLTVDPTGNQTPHLRYLIHREGAYRTVHPTRLGEQRRRDTVAAHV